MGWREHAVALQGRSGHKELVELMISKGADNWNDGLAGACQGGHTEIVKLMIKKGATNWNGGLYRACKGCHKELIELMIIKGANDFSYALTRIPDGNQMMVKSWFSMILKQDI